MKIAIHTVATTTPEKLWATIKEYIAEEKIKTWEIAENDKGVEFLTHTPPQWHRKALLRYSFVTNPSRLVLTVDWFTKSVPNEYTKGLYIGRFTEELLEHFSAYFSKLETFA